YIMSHSLSLLQCLSENRQIIYYDQLHKIIYRPSLEPLLSKIKGVHVQGSFFKNTGTAISIHPPDDRPSPGGITIL
ncbi:hypothetical protein, partial [Legionella spiritensis]|uniref:hypothetical protein n=1 Tax=Legionella spiritensis TaxID=452 RepID=UPI001A953842